MQDQGVLANVARQHGFHAAQASVALDMTTRQLRERGHRGSLKFYLYRSTGSGAGGRDAQERVRLVLAFATADTALAFAQHNRLRPTPRLLNVGLEQLLALMLQRPTIGTLLFADEPLEITRAGKLPTGLRIERAAFLKLLEGG
jgi:hypothetical protein